MKSFILGLLLLCFVGSSHAAERTDEDVFKQRITADCTTKGCLISYAYHYFMLEAIVQAVTELRTERREAHADMLAAREKALACSRDQFHDDNFVQFVNDDSISRWSNKEKMQYQADHWAHCGEGTSL